MTSPKEQEAKIIEKGIALYRSRKFPEAEQLFRELIQNYPDSHQGWYWLGNTLSMAGSKSALEEAAYAYINADKLKPNAEDTLFQLGCTQQELHQYNIAAETLERLLRVSPQHAKAHCTLAICLGKINKNKDASEHYLTALKLEPQSPLINAQYAYFLEDLNDNQNALNHIQQAVKYSEHKPEYTAAQGRILVTIGDIEKAFSILNSASTKHTNHPDICLSLGVAYAALGEKESFLKAVSCYDKALQTKPNADDIIALKSIALLKAGEISRALTTIQAALHIAPNLSSHYQNYANILVQTTNAEDAVNAAKKAIELDPSNHQAYSNFLFYLHYINIASREDILRLHKQWAEYYSQEIDVNNINYFKTKQANDKIRLGFVSGDFRTHSVAFFLLPLLENIDRSNFEIYCYSNFPGQDRITERIKLCSDKWSDISSLNDNDAAECIIQDQPDILIDLSGHSAYNRLSIFLRRLAPLQISWLGYPDTTGLNTIDYRIVDEFSEPENENGAYSSEKLLRIESGFHCYQPPKDCPDIQQSPCIQNGYITFGSFNNSAKITLESIELWSKVLHKIPNSKILLKSLGLGDAGVRKNITDKFAQYNIDDSRIILAGKTQSIYEHLDYYNQVDIALDTFPYCGTTTTCEALWMGVPVISLIGDRHAARMGWSLLNSCDFEQFACKNKELFVNVCCELSSSPKQLQELRNTMRPKLKESKLYDAPDFAQRFSQKLLYIYQNSIS